ncbi:MAG TPA: 16S rRNA (guanine(527)-N(7))-methyltransferase RsmG [Candidatus Nanopelagicaceae bacterium]
MTVSRETLLEGYFQENPKKIDRYVEILKSWGIDRGLIGPREGERIWDRHIANCLPVTTLIPQGVKVVDIGSGAGLPGVVIALARPDLEVTLIEPLQRRVDFLNEVIAELELPISVIRGKSESVKRSFEIVTARAVAPLPKLLTISWHLVKAQGALLAMKGEGAQNEIDETEPKKHSITSLHTIELPDFELARVIEVRKTA